MSFTIDDLLQIAFFQAIYVVLFIYLTFRELKHKPKTSLFWLIIASDIIYTVMLAWTSYYALTYKDKTPADPFRWFLFLFASLGLGVLMLLTFVIYNVMQDIAKFSKKGLKQL